MKRTALIVSLLVIGALAVMLTGTAFAQDDTPTTPEPKGFFGGPAGFGHGPDGQVWLDAAAEALGMSAEDLENELWAGKTLSDLADEAGVDIQDIRDAVEAAQEQATRDAIQQAVDDGTITQGHADWLIEGLDNGYWQGGMGRGGHFGGMRGGRHGGMQFAPPIDSNGTSTTPSTLAPSVGL
jgi:hypothetical protein